MRRPHQTWSGCFRTPDGNEEEPSSDVEDDFEDPDFEQVHARVQAQHTHAADTAGELGVPAQRPTRTATTAANQAMDALHARGELV